MTPRRIAMLLGAPALAVALSGCVSLLPKTKPSQLYSFGHGIDLAPAAASEQPTGATGVLLGAVTFPRASTGDGILSVTGTQSAYIAESRWVAPAALLFRESVERAFDRTAKTTRLINRGEAARIALTLRVDVHDFAVLYPNGPEGLPVVALSMQARLIGNGGVLVGEKDFDLRKPVAENRVGPIVAAFDAATTEAMTGLVAWTDQTAATLPPAQTVPPPR